MIFMKSPSQKQNIYVILHFILSVFLPAPGISQGFEPIHLEEITHRKIRKYIVELEIDQMNEFSSIKASWKKDTDESDFNVEREIFYLDYELSDVWDCYRHADPVRILDGQSVRMGLLISKCSNTVIYNNNSIFPGLDTGQVYFLNLRLMKGLFNVPVAFEIINIDNVRQRVEISYIEHNKSIGKQTIEFFDNGDGHTRILHSSFFKSGSLFRDNFLYPVFHKKFVKEFHRNMKHFFTDRNLIVSL